MKIELCDIHKYFGPVRANDGISLEIESGIIYGLLGENGAGKTTLMKILSGYQGYDKGRILLDGQPVRFTSPAEALRAGIGMLHQDPLDIPSLTVLDNLMLGSVGGFWQRGRQARATLRNLAERFNFALDPEAPVRSLTVGERQQLELLRLLSLGARVIILDEPTTGISAPQKALLFETLKRLAQEGLAVVFVSHKLDEVEQLCGRVTVLRNGRVAGQATAPQRVALGEVVLELDDVTVATYRLTVPHVSLKVRQGEVLGLAGLEGSGQRLLMQACAGLQPIVSGRLRIAGQEMAGQPYRRFLQLGVAFVPAARLEEGMVPGLTLREHFALAAPERGLLIPWKEAEFRAEEMIRAFNIIGRPQTPVQDLSGGNQQRALLALLPERLRLLILEHPTRGLDLGSSQWIWGKLMQRREQGTAILFTSTDLGDGGACAGQ